jgi:hypothetical protein
MTKAELIDTHFHDFLKWCSQAPEGKSHELVFWLEHRFPTEDNFWEWIVEVRKDLLNGS